MTHSTEQIAEQPEADGSLDFDTVEMYVRMAREAHASGDELKCFAARKMASLALRLDQGPGGIRFHTEHLKAG